MLASELIGEDWLNEHDDIDISGIAYDSRNVGEGNIFVCIKGYETDGHKFAKMAEENGAALIVAQDKIDVNVPVWYVENSRVAIAQIASRYYGNPSERFRLIGVTGTNGKTTITYLIKSIIETAGMRIGVIGTNQNIIGDKVLVTQSTTPTTPNALELQQLFAEMVQGEAECVVMEVSSHALELERVYGCRFDVGVFTNLTRDHLDFHGTMENYLNAKAKLFNISDKGVVNFDDDGGKKIVADSDCDILTVGLGDGCDLKAKDIKISSRGADFKVDYDGKTYPVHIVIPGKFSVYNAICAMGAAIQLGVDMDTIIRGLENASGVVGRVEVVPTDTDYTVIIDYAHTPDGLENIISTVNEFAEGRVITLFGCGGDRDNTKRAIMGEIAGRLSDFSIITSDNPRTENPEAIVEQIEEGMKRTDGDYITIVDRREAIGYALDNAKKGDVIILAGKGQETYQIIGKEKHDFDERIVVYQHLNK
ncbi:MAG: UDP-N-acetylmuramoyl-L-alanyl-D-glutamate--2,6-diaminopimelate ligase [Oscillospiraceae bacterium]|nr:UDP-N-acetylmuramoyl-L-alanyl-D-glutamate--2,6-diaminopimelate ligase [Oscillospiraceae bacterium]